MKLKAALPFLIATVLLILLFVMVQTSVSLVPSTLGSPRVSSQAAPLSEYFYLPPGASPRSSVTEADYQEVIRKFTQQNFLKVYQQTGRPLVVPFEWDSPFFGAYAQDKEIYLQISLWGGMARAPGSSKATLAAILCHELGHFLGGEPRQTMEGSTWSSTEGQSDFYAASVCLPELLRAHPEWVPTISSDVLKVCGPQLSCQRVLQAGLETVQLFQRYSYRENIAVSLQTSENFTSELIRNTYPSDQCRLDTYVAGALCQLGGACRAPRCWLPVN